jgi:hypothetical protein
VLVNDELGRVGRRARETPMKTFRWTKAGAVTALCLIGILPARRSSADPSMTDKAMATQLFKEGRTLLDEGRVGPACLKLEESQRIDPGGGTLLNLALCHERLGRTATAWVEFTEALGLAKRDDRAQRVEFASAHIAQLETDLSRLTIEVPSGADVPDLEVKRDGTVVARAVWGSPVPVDPGDHVIEATAPEKVHWKQSVVLGPKADSKTIVIPMLDNAPAADSAASAPATPVVPAVAATAAGTEADENAHGTPASGRSVPGRGQGEPSPSAVGTVTGWTAIALGVAGGGVGTYFALHALALKHDADRNCPGNRCSVQGENQTSDSLKSADFATVSFGVGIAGLAVGTVILATRPSSHSSTSATLHPAPAALTLTGGDVSLGPGGGQVSISGRW